ncbi:hypothetical protein EDD22DRAFT_151575 [Suillus occidentalis]|nr:hypothetical protein EDD22DRAFT_151575 [Suillus occidentalis]
MSSISFSEVADLQVSKFANIGAFAILIFDFCITFQDEVKWTWSRPWDITRVIFVISRYLPFIGSALTAYAALRVSGPPAPSLAENSIHILSIVAAEGLLLIRTWAFWQKSKTVLIGLIAYSMVTIIAAVSMNVFPNHQLISAAMSTLPEQGGFESSRNAALVNSATTDKPEGSIISTVYGGSVFNMGCIIAITVTNVIIDAVFPVGFSNMLDTLQLVVHSVLGSRIMFHLRSSHDQMYKMHTSLPIVSEIMQFARPWQTQTNERSNASCEV